jgi:hypothetical protein
MAGTLRSNLTIGLAAEQTMNAPRTVARSIRAALENPDPAEFASIPNRRLLCQWGVLLHQWATLLDEVSPNWTTAAAVLATASPPPPDEAELMDDPDAPKPIPVNKGVEALWCVAARLRCPHATPPVPPPCVISGTP